MPSFSTSTTLSSSRIKSESSQPTRMAASLALSLAESVGLSCSMPGAKVGLSELIWAMKRIFQTRNWSEEECGEMVALAGCVRASQTVSAASRDDFPAPLVVVDLPERRSIMCAVRKKKNLRETLGSNLLAHRTHRELWMESSHVTSVYLDSIKDGVFCNTPGFSDNSLENRRKERKKTTQK